MSKYQEIATVTRVEQFGDQNYRFVFDAPLIAAQARPGQFVMVRVAEGKDPLLRRPFSIHLIDEDGRLHLFVKVIGRGSKIFSLLKVGQQVSLLGPLGRSFDLKKDYPAVMVGGGVGIAPLLFLAARLQQASPDNIAEKRHLVILGGRSKTELLPLIGDFEKYEMEVKVATDDGSLGHHGLVTGLLDNDSIAKDALVYCCGPEAMMVAVAGWCKNHERKCQVSVESSMACGMGACLGCSRPDKQGGYTHVCINGPVYNAEELTWKK